MRGIGHDGVAARLGQSGDTPAVHEDAELASKHTRTDGKAIDWVPSVVAMPRAGNPRVTTNRWPRASMQLPETSPVTHCCVWLGSVFRRIQRSGKRAGQTVYASASLPLCTGAWRRWMRRPAAGERGAAQVGRDDRLSVMRPPTFIKSNRGTRGARRNDFGSACSAVSCSKYRFRSSPYAAPLRSACPGPPAARDRSAAS